MSPLDPIDLPGADAPGLTGLGGQPAPVSSHPVDLDRIGIETGEMGGSQPERFHVKPK
jgi:hypothetical protein